jgi:predicted dehydrogenase
MAQNDDVTRRGFLAVAGQGILLASAAAAGIPLAPPDKQPPDLEVPKEPGKKVGYAIVGLGDLALNHILPGFAESAQSRPVALVSGHREKAEKTAAHYGIDPKAIYSYDDYEKMADNPQIDAVYIVLPNSMHAEYTIRAAKIGKHVLCEKPMCNNAVEAQQMIDACKAANKKLMIAYRLRYEPFNQTMIDLSRKQAYGKIRSIEAVNIQQVKAPNIRLAKALGGGPMGDVGVYCLNATRYITGEEPIEFTATEQQNPDDPRFAEVAEGYAWTQKFPSGITASCSCGFGSAESRRYRVHCTDGWLELENAFTYSGLRLRIKDKKGQAEISLPQVDHFAHEMDHFSQCVLSDKTPLTPGEEGLADMKAMMFIVQSAETGKTIKASDQVPTMHL